MMPNDVRFGSLAALQHRISSTAAIERIPDARLRFPGCSYLTGRFHQERSFKTLSNQQNDRPLTAKSGRSERVNWCAMSADRESKESIRLHDETGHPNFGQIRIAIRAVPLSSDLFSRRAYSGVRGRRPTLRYETLARRICHRAFVRPGFAIREFSAVRFCTPAPAPGSP